jgi:hypothetical protein
VIRYYAQHETAASKSSPIDGRIAELAKLVAFTLNAAQEIGERVGNKTHPEPSEITLATPVGDHIEVAHMDVAPVEWNGGYRFVPTLRRKLTVGEAVQYEVAGQEAIGRPFLDGTETAVTDSDILNFRRAIKENRGRELSLEDMIDTARKVAILTSDRAKSEVGGPIEIGTIEHGVAKIVQENPMLTVEDRRASTLFNVVGETQMSGGGINSELADNETILFVDSYFRRTTQKLDGRLFYSNVFDGCTLLYDGSPRTLVDSSNNVPGSVVVIARIELLQTPFMIQLRKDFPDLQIGLRRSQVPTNSEAK